MKNTCSSCGFESATPARLCLKCGAVMPQADASEETSTTPAAVAAPQPPAQTSPMAAPTAPAAAAAPQRQNLPFGSVSTPMAPPPPPPPPPPPRPPAAVKPAATTATSTPAATPGATNAKGSSTNMVVIGVVVAVIAGAGFMFMGNSTPPAPAPVAVKPGKPAPAPEATTTAKDELNQLLGLVRDGRWKEVGPKVQLIKSMSQVSVGNSKASAEASAAADQTLKAGNAQEAANQFEKAVALDAANAEARFGLGTSLVRSGKASVATAVLIDGLLIAPDRGAGWLAAAEVFAENGKDEAAVSSLKLAIHLAKNREGALKFLGAANDNIPNAKLRKVIETAMPSLSGVPGK